MTGTIQRSKSPKVNGYVKAVLAREAMRALAREVLGGARPRSEQQPLGAHHPPDAPDFVANASLIGIRTDTSVLVTNSY